MAILQLEDAIMVNVRCAKCGLLGVREKSSGRIVEVTETGREYGQESPTRIRENRIGPFLCCAQVQRFPEQQSEAKLLLDEERNCDRFVAWQTGFLPKEHIDMNILEENRRWQEKRDARTIWVNFLFLLATAAAALAAWWSATHPTVIVIPQPPDSATTLGTPANTK